jgi:hypothetical protein
MQDMEEENRWAVIIAVGSTILLAIGAWALGNWIGLW